jgi:hypothetical protein
VASDAGVGPPETAGFELPDGITLTGASAEVTGTTIRSKASNDPWGDQLHVGIEVIESTLTASGVTIRRIITGIEVEMSSGASITDGLRTTRTGSARRSDIG